MYFIIVIIIDVLYFG